MQSWNRNISDSYLAIVTSSYSNEISTFHIKDMHNLDVLLGNTFEYDTFLFRLLVRQKINIFPRLIWKRIEVWVRDSIWKSLFAQLALQSFPAIGFDWIVLLDSTFRVEPFPQTVNMDQFHGPSTFARWNQRISLHIIIRKANTTDWCATLRSWRLFH